MSIAGAFGFPVDGHMRIGLDWYGAQRLGSGRPAFCVGHGEIRGHEPGNNSAREPQRAWKVDCRSYFICICKVSSCDLKERHSVFSKKLFKLKLNTKESLSYCQWF